jgi:hypothetical protein
MSYGILLPMMEGDEIQRLRAEIEYLKGEINELHGMFNRVLKFELKATTKHLRELYKRTRGVNVFSRNGIRALHDIVSPIEEKIFPEVSKARQQLMDIVKKAEVEFNSDPPDEKQNKKNS